MERLTKELLYIVVCPECGREFDLTTEADTSEWYAGHDCESKGNA